MGLSTTKGGGGGEGGGGSVPMTDVGQGDESLRNPSLSGCDSNNPPSGDDIPATSLDLESDSGH